MFETQDKRRLEHSLKRLEYPESDMKHIFLNRTNYQQTKETDFKHKITNARNNPVIKSASARDKVPGYRLAIRMIHDEMKEKKPE